MVNVSVFSTLLPDTSTAMVKQFNVEIDLSEMASEIEQYPDSVGQKSEKRKKSITSK